MRCARGFSLPEIMVSITLGLLLLAAFLHALARCRAEFAANGSVASLQDTARHALSALMPELEHAGFLGFDAAAAPVLTLGGNVVAESAQLVQSGTDLIVEPVAGLPAGAHACGVNFAVDVTRPVQMTNNTFRGAAAGGCDPTASAGGARAGSDTLTVRHASLEVVAPRPNRLQLYTRRFGAAGQVALFADGVVPGPVDEHAEVRDLEVHTWYVANDSVSRPGWPALRMKTLTEAGGRAQFRDEEILTGVEDLQVELVLADAENRVRFISADSVPDGEHVVAVRLWLRIRADHTEGGFVDPETLGYAGVSFTPDAAERRHRRMLLTRTVALRNLRRP